MDNFAYSNLINAGGIIMSNVNKEKKKLHREKLFKDTVPRSRVQLDIVKSVKAAIEDMPAELPAKIITYQDVIRENGDYYLLYQGSDNLQPLAEYLNKNSVSSQKLMQEFKETVELLQEIELIKKLFPAGINAFNFWIDENEAIFLMPEALLRSKRNYNEFELELPTKDYFVPPEIIEGEEWQQNSYLFNITAVFYYFLSGETIFRDQDNAKVLNKIKTEKILELKALLPQISEQLNTLIMKLLAKDKSERMELNAAASELEKALEITAREAKNYFGNEHVYIEHYFRDPRHIEVQIVGDKKGNLIHLFERECSLQRRHQKVIEEAPSPSVNKALRKRLTDSALKLAREIGYYNAGTVEFLVDPDENIYFLEMNTRIQVEHPVTEMITGLDIVELQLYIAEGRDIGLKQSDISMNGHAIQARLYAENPEMNYQPSPGYLEAVEYPKSHDIRVDTALLQQAYISPDYDPMIAKVIAHDETRNTTIDKLYDYLKQLTIVGKPTNQQFLRFILKQQDLIDNKISTQYLEQHTSEIIARLNEEKNRVKPEKLIAFFVLYELLPNSHADNIWQEIGFWRLRQRMLIKLDDKEYTVLVKRKNKTVHMQIGETSLDCQYSKHSGRFFTVYLDDVQEKFKIVKQNNTGAVIQYKGFYFDLNRFDVLNTNHDEITRKIQATTQGNVISPVYGRVVSINVQEGSNVKVGQTLLVLESMKIENNIAAEADIQIEKICVEEGEQIKDGQELIRVTNDQVSA